MMSIQAQWNLDSTSDSAISIARGILRAATSDNVQPLAILACERFGCTIAMSQETCRKIQTSVTPTPEPGVIHFLRGTVGFSANDCATQLSRSLAGVQFLGLAAALVTTLGPFEGGNTLEVLLKSSAADTTLLPTARQLKDLLASLEARCQLCGFADTVVGWYIMLRQLPRLEDEQRWRLKISESVPSPEGLEKLVEAFRQLNRLGQSTITRATIKTGACAPWVAAFTKWCLGTPPSIYLDDGTPVLEQLDPKVIVIAPTSGDNMSNFEITIHHSVGAPAELVAPGDDGRAWIGMVSIECYGRWLLKGFDLDTGDASRALVQAVPHAVQQVIASLKFSKYRVFDQSAPIRDWGKKSGPGGPQIDSSLLELALIPFRGIRAISEMLSRILNIKVSEELPALEDGMLIADLPVVKMYLQFLEKHCICSKCSLLNGYTAKKNHLAYNPCDKDVFFERTAFIVADILALSLFQYSEPLLVQLRRRRSISDEFNQAVSSILSTGSPMDCSISSLLHWALDIVGHPLPNNINRLDWVMSSVGGQVVYPTIFDTCCVEKYGYLALSWMRGLLKYGGETYPRVTSSMKTIFGTDPITGFYTGNVSQPCNLVPALKLDWKISVRDNVLNASLGLENSSFSHITHDPTIVLLNLADALLLEACPHDRDLKLETVDQFSAYTGPILPLNTTRNRETGTVDVVAVDGADDLRLFSLCFSTCSIVVRKNACLSCCLEVCRRTNFPVLIL